MTYFPFYIDVTGQSCLLVGGGAIAYHKARILTQYGVSMHIVAPEIADEIMELKNMFPKLIHISKREYEEEDLKGAYFVIAATADQVLNHLISVTCKSRGILVNVVDIKEECSFIMPAILHSSEMDIAISTGGKSPAAARYLKEEIEKVIPEHFDELVHDLGLCRNYVMKKIEGQAARKEAFEWLLVLGLANDCRLNEKLLNQVVERFGKIKES